MNALPNVAVLRSSKNECNCNRDMRTTHAQQVHMCRTQHHSSQGLVWISR